MSDRSDFGLESIPAWVRDALIAAQANRSPARTPLAYLDATAWKLLLEAAVVGPFLPRELAPGAVPERERPEAEKVVLGFAETSHAQGEVKWSLIQSARTEILKAALGTDELATAVVRTADRFGDAISRALRECLTRAPQAASTSDLLSLEAMRVAVSMLSGISALPLPSLTDLDREIEFRRLMRPFERMIGRGGGSGRQQAERFFGRDQEMEQLRGYVGMIGADSFQDRTRRTLQWLSRIFTGRAPLALWGVGGVGKTTLLSKFMLEHAEDAFSRYPFAYLDFDRSTINARQGAGLLSEMCLQTGAQFKELWGPMLDLRASVSMLARRFETASESVSMSSLGSLALMFRQLVDDHLKSQQRTLEGDRPFLLVFDTFEVVQYTHDGIPAMEDFVASFSRPGESGLWPRLRLIISGRKKVGSFLGQVEELQLGALDSKGSIELLLALAGDAGKPISPVEAKRFVATVAKATGERRGGIQPLRLHLIGEVFRITDGEGKTIARSLANELSETLQPGGLTATVLIDGILIRRVLGHVSDPRVRALADPGLVLRRITPDLIRAVMTRGSLPPGRSEPTDPDETPDEQWIVDEEEAVSIFEAFRREVSLVEQDGNALRHRADVRQQMLPLIRARRPLRFRGLNRLAFDYYLDRAEADETDLISAAEAIYHGLWLGEPLQHLNSLWRDSPSFEPRLDADEFGRGSPAGIFVRAKARETLAPEEVSSLPRDVAIEWLGARSARLLNSRRVEEAIKVIRAAAGDDYEALNGLEWVAADVARLQYRAGHWDEAARLAMRHILSLSDPSSRVDLPRPSVEMIHNRYGTWSEEPSEAALISLVRTWATLVGKSGGPEEAAEHVAALADSVRDPIARLEVAAYAAVATFSLRAQKRQSAPLERRGAKLASLISKAAGTIKPTAWRGKQRILRLAILTGRADKSDLLNLWIDYRERLPRDAGGETIGNLLFKILPGGQGFHAEVEDLMKASQSRWERGWALNRLDEIWRIAKANGMVAEALHKNKDLMSSFRRLLIFDNSDWVRPLGNALTHSLKSPRGNDLIEELYREGFRARNIKRARSRDGVAIVELAADDGRLLQFAALLVNSKIRIPQIQESIGRITEYPTNIFDLCDALLRWQTTVEDILGRDHLTN